MKKEQNHIQLIFNYSFKNFCSVLMLLLYSYTAFTQNTSTENQNDIEILVLSISK
jgi:hypothetical protein